VNIHRQALSRDTSSSLPGQRGKGGTGLHGQRLTVNAGGWLAKSARLDGLPNSFVAEDVIAHAARRAGVLAQ
jgi:hypothetical protein